MQIFCPSNHLILDQNICDKCGWKRPVLTSNGSALWEIRDFDTGLGGENRDTAVPTIIANNTLILPLKSNELVGINITNGAVKWRRALPAGLQVTGFANAYQQVVVSLQDIRSLMENDRFGGLYQLNTKDGGLNLIWKAPSHGLNQVLSYQDHFVVRSSNNTIYGLKQSDPQQIDWQIKTQSWIPLPILQQNELIFFVDGSRLSGKGFINCFNQSSKAIVWQADLSHGVPGFPSTLYHDHLFVVDGTQSIKAFDTKNGNLVWEQSFSRIYSPPDVQDGVLALAVRGNLEIDAIDHYKLTAYEIGSWKNIFNIALSAKSVLPPFIFSNQIVVACNDGSLRCYNLGTEEKIWVYQLGHQEDPIKTSLTQYENSLVIGTAQGKLALVTIYQRDKLESPQIYLEAGEWAQAAAAYALEKEFRPAAELYLNQIKDIPKAVQLYAQGGFFSDAGSLALANNLWTEALEYFEKVNDHNKLAETYLKMGNELRAAEYFSSAGDPLKAAQLMENAEKYELAIEYFQKAKNSKDVYRLKINLGLFTASDINDLKKQNRYQEAADLEMKNQMYEEAARDYQKANLQSEALSALQKAGQRKPEEFWIWEEIAQLAEKLNQFEISGQAWSKLDKPLLAGNAFKLAAESIYGENPAQTDQVAHIYGKAIHAYESGGYDETENYQDCMEKLRELRKYPNILLKMTIPSGSLIEYDWSHIFVEFVNNGYGVAENIRFEIDSERFDIDKLGTPKLINLDCGVNKRFIINLRPKKDEHGDVPLQIQWIWEKRGIIFERCESKKVSVKMKEEPHVSSQVTIVYGDQVAQKGDSVLIQKGIPGSVKPAVGGETHLGNEVVINHDLVQKNVQYPVVSQENKPGKKCSNCKTINETHSIFCKECGSKFEINDIENSEKTDRREQ